MKFVSSTAVYIYDFHIFIVNANINMLEKSICHWMVSSPQKRPPPAPPPYPAEPFYSLGDWFILSPYGVALESNEKVTRIKEMTTDLGSSSLLDTVPCQFKRRCTENRVENKDTNVRV